jgi:hypothetical protein
MYNFFFIYVNNPPAHSNFSPEAAFFVKNAYGISAPPPLNLEG